MYGPLLPEGIETLHELVVEMEIEQDRNRLRRMRMVAQAFPASLIELAASGEEVNNIDVETGYIIMGENEN